MNAEDTWREAFEAEDAEPSDWEPDLVALEQRIRLHLERRGCEWASIAASVIAARAFGRLDQPTFAAKLGLPEQSLRMLEGTTDRFNQTLE